jgi:hypothetical protein
LCLLTIDNLIYNTVGKIMILFPRQKLWRLATSPRPGHFKRLQKSFFYNRQNGAVAVRGVQAKSGLQAWSGTQARGTLRPDAGAACRQKPKGSLGCSFPRLRSILLLCCYETYQSKQELIFEHLHAILPKKLIFEHSHAMFSQKRLFSTYLYFFPLSFHPGRIGCLRMNFFTFLYLFPLSFHPDRMGGLWTQQGRRRQQVCLWERRRRRVGQSQRHRLQEKLKVAFR